MGKVREHVSDANLDRIEGKDEKADVLRFQATYKWYLSMKREDLGLPHLEPNVRHLEGNQILVQRNENQFIKANGEYELLAQERYCRVPGCGHDNLFSSTNSLRKHYQDKHPSIRLHGPANGGRHTVEQENKAIVFYKALQDNHGKSMAQMSPGLPSVPLKRDGTIYVTKMRQIVRDQGFHVPCDACQDANRTPSCCRESGEDICEHFELFKPREVLKECQHIIKMEC